MEPSQQVLLRENISSPKRTWFLLYLVFVTFYTLTFAVVIARTISPFVTGDWLINYSGGFVRRGLVGSVVLLVGRATGFSSAWIVFALEAATFLIFIGCTYRLTKGIRWTYWMAAVVLSPATLSFTVMDSYAGLRKETLLFAGLAFTLCVLASGHYRMWQLILMLSFLSVALVLSHEALVIGAPYFFAAVAIHEGGVLRALRICAIPALLGVIALIAVILHPGNFALANTVCNSLSLHLRPFGSQEQNLCSGSIAWLQFSSRQAIAMTLPAIRHYHRVRLYSLLAIPTFAPLIGQLIVLWRRRNRQHREEVVLLICTFVSMFGTGLLLLLALDWGRWIHIQAVCLMLMVLRMDRHAAPATPTAIEHTVTKKQRNWLDFAGLLTVALYATTWTLPPTGRGDGLRGYLDVARTLRLLHRAGQASASFTLK